MRIDLLKHPYYRSWRSLVLIVLAICNLAVFAASSHDEVETPAASADTLTAALQEFMPKPGPLRLETAAAHVDLYVPISARFLIQTAELKLRFVNSISLLRERSQLRVELNGLTVGQLPLQPDKAQVDVALSLPAESLRPGYNRLSFSVAQHYTLDCEDPFAPELWTEIDTVHSSLELRGKRPAVHATLAEIDSLIGPALGNSGRYRMLMPKGAGPATLAAGAAVAQGLGLHLRYRAADFVHATAQPLHNPNANDPLGGLDEQNFAGTDSVLVGTRDELQTLLSATTYNAVTDAYLALVPASADARNFVLLVSGTTPEQVQRAADSLGILNFPYADASNSLLHRIDQPKGVHFAQHRPIRMGHTYRFRDLGYNTVTVGGINARQLELELMLPPDFNAPEDAEVGISLNFAYGASMRRDSVLNVELNNVLQRAIALNNPEGAVLNDYRVFVPLRAFLPGRNVLRFNPALVPLVKGRCINLNEYNLRLTLFDDSTVHLPPVAHYTSQPDLGLFSRTGFPYHGGDGAAAVPVNVALAGTDENSLAAAWMLFAKLAQVADRVLPDAHLVQGLPQDDRQLIVLAANDQVDARLFSKAPLSLGSLQKLPYPAGRSSDEHTAGTEPDDEPDDEPAVLSPAPVSVEESAGPVAHGMIAAFAAPFAEQRTATLITAGTTADLRDRVASLVRPVIWDHIDGDIVLWTDVDAPLASQRAGKSYQVGTAPVSTKLRTHFSHSPWFWALGVFALIVVLAWLTRLLLSRRFQARHGNKVRIDP